MTRLRVRGLRSSFFPALTFFILTVGVFLGEHPTFLSAQTPGQAGGERVVSNALRARAQRNGRVRVIVELKLPSGRHVPEGQLGTAQAIAAQRRDILEAAMRLDGRLGSIDRRMLRRYESVPYVALE